MNSGSSGAGHGGSGGRGENEPFCGSPYGNLYEPNEFGSSGGGTANNAGWFCFCSQGMSQDFESIKME